MRLFLWLLALMAAAIGIAVTARFNPGNVVMFYPPYRFDLSLNFFLVLQAALFIVLYMLIRAFRITLKMPGRVAIYREQKREHDGNNGLREALKSLFEGRFGHAEKAALRAAELPANAALAALIGAKAAHRMRQSERCDQWLGKAATDPALKAARLMTQIELLVDAHQPEAALDAVRELSASGTRHLHALQWSLKAHQQAKNWPEVLRLVRTLDKRSALHPALSSRLRELAYEDLLSDRAHDVESLRRVWSTIPSEDRVLPYVAARAAAAFNARGLHQEARLVVEDALLVNWDGRVVQAYRAAAAAAGSAALLAQIEHCEAWNKQHPTDAELALTLGTLCLKQKLWGKAQRYLEQALSDASEPRTIGQAHLQLAQMHDALSQLEQAAFHYRLCALATIL
ncbi:MAG: HemY protein [Janthinobacterium sp.]|jgi:HemY protein